MIKIRRSKNCKVYLTIKEFLSAYCLTQFVIVVLKLGDNLNWSWNTIFFHTMLLYLILFVTHNIIAVSKHRGKRKWLI